MNFVQIKIVCRRCHGIYQTQLALVEQIVRSINERTQFLVNVLRNNLATIDVLEEDLPSIHLLRQYAALVEELIAAVSLQQN